MVSFRNRSITMVMARSPSQSCCVRLDLAEVVVQALEALFPMAAVLAHPVCDVPQRPGSQPSRSPLRLPALFDEARPFEHPEMLRDGWLAHVERCGQVLDRRLALGESGQDRPPGRVGEGGERDAEGIGRLHVHHFLVI